MAIGWSCGYTTWLRISNSIPKRAAFLVELVNAQVPPTSRRNKKSDEMSCTTRVRL